MMICLNMTKSIMITTTSTIITTMMKIIMILHLIIFLLFKHLHQIMKILIIKKIVHFNTIIFSVMILFSNKILNDLNIVRVNIFRTYQIAILIFKNYTYYTDSNYHYLPQLVVKKF